MKTTPPTYSKEKPQTIPLDKVYVHVGYEKIYFGRGGDLVRGGLVREPTSEFGPQRDPTERLDWVQKQVDNFKPLLFRDPLRLSKDENGEYSDTDGGGRALMAHILGHPTVEAFVTERQTLFERATEFRELATSRVPLKAVQLFLTYVAAGSPRHNAIFQAIAPYYTVKSSGADAISSVAALYAVYDHADGAPADKNSANPAGANLLRRTAEMCHTAWGPVYETDDDGKRKLVRKAKYVAGTVFVAVALVLQAGVPNEKKLIDWLTKKGPEYISQKATENLLELARKSAKFSAAAAFKTVSIDMAIPMAMVIVREYNVKRAGKDRINVEAVTESNLALRYSKTRVSRHLV